MRRGGRFAGDQAELVFSDKAVEQLDEFTAADQVSVLADVVALCGDPSGKHPLSGALAGWNTLVVLAGRKRVVFKASEYDSVGLLEVLCLGPRSDNEVYDIAVALVGTGVLAADEVTQLWEALVVLDVVAESVGLNGWDYRPPPAPQGMVRTAVSAGLLDEGTAALLSKDELAAAMEAGWGPAGADPARALRAALERARTRVEFPGLAAITGRAKDRCGALMPRAAVRCIRADGHPGPHRSK